MKSQKEIAEAIKNQKKLCEEKDLPHFAPYNGICFSCCRQIYEVTDGNYFITGCPLCHRTYCD